MLNRDINFFSTYVGQKKEKKNQNIYIYTITTFLTVLILGTLAWNTVNLFIVNDQIKVIDAKLNDPTIQSQIKESEVVNSKLNILESYNKDLTKVVTAIDNRSLINNTILDKISSVLPSDVTFKNINITNGNVSISAASKTRTAIAEVQHNLKSLDIIGDVTIGSISGDGSSGEYTFDLKCVLMGE